MLHSKQIDPHLEQSWQNCLGSPSQELLHDGLLEAHVLRALDGQPVPGVVVHHLRHRHEAAAEVAQLEVARLGVAADLHVHEALRAPEMIITFVNTYYKIDTDWRSRNINCLEQLSVNLNTINGKIL